MKLPRLLVALVFTGLFVLGARAAEFEGTLKWTFNAEVTDPEMKARMAEVKAQMADPAKLAQMRAMLENPQMRAALEQNPQMRAALQAQIRLAEDAAAGRGGDDMFTAMMPKSATLSARGGRTHFLMEGGAMPMEVISHGQPATAYWIDRETKTFARLQPPPAAAETAKPTFKVTATGKTAKLLGYSCEEYVVEVVQEGRTLRNTLWATDDIPGLDSETLARTQIGGQDAAYLAQVKGVPLKMEIVMPQMRLVMQASAVSAAPVPDSLFIVPPDFKERPSPFAQPLPATSKP